VPRAMQHDATGSNHVFLALYDFGPCLEYLPDRAEARGVRCTACYLRIAYIPHTQLPARAWGFPRLVPRRAETARRCAARCPPYQNKAHW
jgi:hypothetical protein